MKWGAIFALVVVLVLLPTVGLADGVCPCPENAMSVAKFEWDEDSGTYIQTEGTVGVATIGEGADASGGSWTSAVEVRAVVVKGATDCYTYSYDPTTTSGIFSNEVLEPTPSGESPDISSVEFCKPRPTAVRLVDFNARPPKLPWYLELLRRLWP